MKRLLYDRIKQMLASGETELGWFRKATDFYVESYSEREDSICCDCIYIEDGRRYSTYIIVPTEVHTDLDTKEDAKEVFKTALLEAAHWDSNVTEHEGKELSYADARESVVNRIFEKYENKIS